MEHWDVGVVKVVGIGVVGWWWWLGLGGGGGWCYVRTLKHIDRFSHMPRRAPALQLPETALPHLDSTQPHLQPTKDEIKK